MAHITSIEDYRRLAAERRAEKAKAEAAAQTIREVMAEMSGVADSQTRADLNRMAARSIN